MRVSGRRAAVMPFVLLVLAACGGGGGTVASSAGGSLPVTNPTPTAQPPTVAGCRIFPADNPWNTDISAAPVDANSAVYLASMNAPTTFLHPGSNPTYGIPYTSVGAGQRPVPMTFDYASESDPGPYPIPSNAPVEGGPGATGDRHVLVVDSSACKLYELYAAQYVGPGWHTPDRAPYSTSARTRCGATTGRPPTRPACRSWRGFISGATDGRWNDTDLNQLKRVPASAFEVIQAGPIIR